MKTYTIPERATVIYNTVLDVFNWNKKSDCVTPLELAQSQFQGISSTGELCIPGAGIGTYVIAALQAGFLPENITAVEVDPMYYELGSGMFKRFGVNYVHADFLTWSSNMKFDVIVGNPPFQKGGNSAFYTMFFRRVGELLKPAGYFSLVSPSKAGVKYTKGYKELEKLGLNEIQYGMEKMFPNIEQPIAVYKGQDKQNENQKIQIVYDGKATEISRGTVLPVQYLSPCDTFSEANPELTLSIFQKFYNSTDRKVKDRFETLDQLPTCPYTYLSTVAWRYHPDRVKGGPYSFLTRVNDQDQYYATGNRGKFMRFNTVEEAEQMHWLLSKSLVYRFITAASCRAIFLPRVLFEETPDWHGVSTDEELYKVLKLSKIEVDYLNTWNTLLAGNIK